MTNYDDNKETKLNNHFNSFRKSRIKRTTNQGKVATILKLNTSDTKIAEIFALAQPDAIWLDMEHGHSNYSQVENQVNAGKVYDVDSLLRVSRGGYSNYIRGLEIDCAGLIIPQIKSFDDARSVRDFTKFPPIGKRGLDGGNNDGKYTKLQIDKYLKLSNEERLIIYQIETPEVIDDIEKIAEMDGVDALFFGPGDYSLGLGVPGEMNHPEVVKARELVAKIARKNNKIAATPGGPDNLKYIDMGYNLLNLGSDVVGLSSYAENLVYEFSKINS
tara:strand:- start:116 stop:937 length:822 start_codon:yes stop_codon:yes gene_type:complete